MGKELASLALVLHAYGFLLTPNGLHQTQEQLSSGPSTLDRLLRCYGAGTPRYALSPLLSLRNLPLKPSLTCVYSFYDTVLALGYHFDEVLDAEKRVEDSDSVAKLASRLPLGEQVRFPSYINRIPSPWCRLLTLVFLLESN